MVREKYEFTEVLGNEMTGNDGETQYYEMPICVVCPDGSLPEIPNVDNYYNTDDLTNSERDGVQDSMNEFFEYWNKDRELIRQQYCY